MNSKNNLSKVVTIIVCVLAIVMVLIAQIYEKNQDKKAQATKNVQVEQTKAEADKKDPEEAAATDNSQNEELKEYLAEDQLQNVDDSLYVEDASDTYTPTGEREIKIWFSNITVLTDAGVPLWIPTYITDKLQGYINLNIVDPVEEMTIDETTIRMNDETCFFAIDLNNGRMCTVEVDLNTHEFTFGDHKK